MVIYKATNKDTGEFYIGQTDDIARRIEFHRASVFARPDEDLFEWEVIDRAETREELNELEKKYIEELKPKYNKREGGFVNSGILPPLILKTPNDFCFTSTYLRGKGISRQLTDLYTKSGWFRKVDRGLHCKEFNSPNIKYACEQIDGIHIGGLSAIHMKGLAHYIRFSDFHHIYTHGNRYPAWMKGDNFNTRLRINTHKIFTEAIKQPTSISSTERAAIEMVYDCPNFIGIDECENTLSGLTTLRPTITQNLLEECNSIKAKRLFLYFAKKHGHQWYHRLDDSKIDLGSGKRQIRKGGTLDNDYLIVI